MAATRAGDPVALTHDGDQRLLLDAQGHTLSRFYRASSPPKGTAFLRSENAAGLQWRKRDGVEEHNRRFRRGERAGVLPEFVQSGQLTGSCTPELRLIKVGFTRDFRCFWLRMVEILRFLGFSSARLI